MNVLVVGGAGYVGGTARANSCKVRITCRCPTHCPTTSPKVRGCTPCTGICVTAR